MLGNYILENQSNNLTDLICYNLKIEEIPQEIKLIASSLVKLNLSVNIIKSIHPVIGLLYKLESLDLSNNNIENLPNQISNLTNLFELNLNNNNFTSLSDEIGNITSLTELQINFNNIKKISNKIGNLTNLKELYLYYNKITYLPKEINKIIASYIPSYIEINTIIHYLEHYPFNPPTWNLTSVIDKSSSSINLQEYYQYIVNCHNHQYQLSWSPAIWIEHDILNFIERINHFEQIID